MTSPRLWWSMDSWLQCISVFSPSYCLIRVDGLKTKVDILQSMARSDALQTLTDVLYDLEERSLMIISAIDGVLRLPDVPPTAGPGEAEAVGSGRRPLSPSSYARLMSTHVPKDLVTVRMSSEFQDVCVAKKARPVQIDLSAR